MPTNVAIADAMGWRFRREKERFTVNSRAGRSQLLRWTLDQKKRRPVTGKRMRRRQDMRSAPVGAVQSVSNVSTEQGVSSRGQPVLAYLLLAYLLKMPANFVPHYLMIQASSELTRPGTCLVYSWKELPAGFYRLNVTMTRDRIFPLKKCPFSAFLRSALRLFSLPRSAEKISTFRSHLTSFTSF